MHINLLRHGLLVSACCVALCYLLLGSLPAAAQFNLPTSCLAEAGQPAPPPNCHVVRVGPPSFQFPFGETFFFDLDSGRRSDDPAQGGGNAVITVIPLGHTVQWQFFYTHSSTAGTCVLGGLCTPNGQWDSLIKAGNQPTPTTDNLHTVTFSQAGVFTYFCQVHLSLMRGIVVVLASADYDLFANPDPTLVPSPPTPTASMIAGEAGSFTGVLNSYRGFNNTLTLTCASGTPRNPTGCPPAPPVTVVPMPGATFGTRL